MPEGSQRRVLPHHAAELAEGELTGLVANSHGGSVVEELVMLFLHCDAFRNRLFINTSVKINSVFNVFLCCDSSLLCTLLI